MKTKSLLLVLIAFFTCFTANATQTDNGTGATLSNGIWYTTLVSTQYDIQDGNNLDIHLDYPSNKVSFDCRRAAITGSDDKKKIEIQHKVNGNWSVL